MLRNTFVHVRGIGYATERKLWSSGVTTWEEFLGRRRRGTVGPFRSSLLEQGLRQSMEELDAGNHRFFRRHLPTREMWRAFGEFKDNIGYLDIETTGTEAASDITLVGLYDGRVTRQYFDDSLEELPEALDRYQVLVTFNGSTFDLPFLERRFPGLRLHQIHIDLRYVYHRLGMKGGLKAIEKRLRIERSPDTQDVRGWDAIWLWERYQGGEARALDTLLQYNSEDVVNLKPLLEIAYDALKGQCLDGEFRTYSLEDLPVVSPRR